MRVSKSLTSVKLRGYPEETSGAGCAGPDLRLLFGAGEHSRSGSFLGGVVPPEREQHAVDRGVAREYPQKDSEEDDHD